MLRPTVSRPFYLGVTPHLGPKIRFLLLSDRCGFVDVGRHLWREDQSFSGVPRDSWPHFTVSGSRLPQPGGPGLCIYIPQKQGGPVIPQALGSLFVASYDSQGYGGNIGTHLNTGHGQSPRRVEWYSLGADPIENTAFNSSFIIGRRRYPRGPHRKNHFQPYCHWWFGIVWRMSLLRHSVLCRNLVTDACSG
jgi:hypothetical protein